MRRFLRKQQIHKTEHRHVGNFQSKATRILKDHNSSTQQNSEIGKIPHEDLKGL